MQDAPAFFTSEVNLLGECPLWDHRQQRLFWVDTRAMAIKSAARAEGPVTTWTFDKPVGSIGLAPDGLIAALSDAFVLIDGATGAQTTLAEVAIPAPGYRLNDGKADRNGRFIAGHMNPTGGDAGEVWSVDLSGRTRRLETGVGLSNGLCFSPAGDIMYFADTMTGFLRRYAYDPATGQISDRDDFLDCRLHGSLPDGATVDSEGCLWVAMVQTGKLARFAPDGRFLEDRDSPVKYPSCPAIGGADLDQLFVTTISHSGGNLINTEPDAGRIPVIGALPASGLPETVLGAPQHP